MVGAKIDTFSVGFGREIWGFNDRYGTRWKLGWMPLGGFVKFAGDANAASMPDATQVDTDPNNFHNKAIWQKAAVVAAGPAANFALALLIFAFFAMFVGLNQIAPRIGSIEPGSSAEKIGLAIGDTIKSINGKTIVSFEDISENIRLMRGEKVEIRVDRGGELLMFNPVIGEINRGDSWTGKQKIGLLGVGPGPDAKVTVVYTGPVDAIVFGYGRIEYFTITTFRILGRMFTGHESVGNLGGITSIARVMGQAADSGLVTYLWMLGTLSVSIGLLNLFPIPMLDGGHLVFYAIEAVRGKPLGEKAQEWSFKIGFAIVIGLMLLGNGNDLLLRVLPNLLGSVAP